MPPSESLFNRSLVIRYFLFINKYKIGTIAKLTNKGKFDSDSPPNILVSIVTRIAITAVIMIIGIYFFILCTQVNPYLIGV